MAPISDQAQSQFESIKKEEEQQPWLKKDQVVVGAENALRSKSPQIVEGADNDPDCPFEFQTEQDLEAEANDEAKNYQAKDTDSQELEDVN